MARKILPAFGILFALFFLTLLIARFTGMLQYYKIPTIANEPSIKQNEKVFTSNLKDPLPKHFITFKSEYIDSVNSIYFPGYNKGVHYLYRLCAAAGDVVQMKNGLLFVNNKNFDEELDLKNQYKISNKDFYLIEQEDIFDNDSNSQVIHSSDSVIVTFDKLLLKKYHSKIKLTSYIINDTSSLSGCFKWLNKHSTWTVDNFGPLKIPADSYFVLGDNRHCAMDSRYIGFVSRKDIKGVMLGKY